MFFTSMYQQEEYKDFVTIFLIPPHLLPMLLINQERYEKEFAAK